nr:glycoprotein integral membrane protein 1 isoform X2 [Oryctolagus cuniculus]
MEVSCSCMELTLAARSSLSWLSSSEKYLAANMELKSLPNLGLFSPGYPQQLWKDSIRINVTTLKDDGEISEAQVVLNVTYETGQVYINDLPVSSGVTRISCQTLIEEYFCWTWNHSLAFLEVYRGSWRSQRCDAMGYSVPVSSRSAGAGPTTRLPVQLPVNVPRKAVEDGPVKNESLESLKQKECFGVVSVRIVVHEWPMTSGSGLQLLVIQAEVVELDGKQAQPKDVTEVAILVKNQQTLRRSSYTRPLEASVLHSLSRGGDALFTLPSLSKKVESAASLQTTSQYLIRNVETTVDGDALPGKLPETPLRAEPPSSYKVMCQWMEKFRKDLCGFWGSVFPLFFMFLNVVVVGIMGAAVVITILKVLFPWFDYKGILQLDQVNVIPMTAVNLYPDGLEKKVENLEDKAWR